MFTKCSFISTFVLTMWLNNLGVFDALVRTTICVRPVVRRRYH